MFGGSKVKLSNEAFEKARVAADIYGCSLEEFVEKAINAEAEKAFAKTSSKDVSDADVEDIANKLKGLGYLE
jgi:uncharacterized protein (DUF1778 family)